MHIFTEDYFERTGTDRDQYVSVATLKFMDKWGLEPDVLAARREATTAFMRDAHTRPMATR